MVQIIMDKRVLRTKESIKTAFMQLMLESELEKINVSDITKKAKINRSTFYLHYGDISDVIEDIDKDFSDFISKKIDDFDISDIYNSIYRIFINLTTALEKQKIKRKYIIYSYDSANITNKLKHLFARKTYEALINRYPDLDKEKIIFPLTYASSGIVESYIEWCHTEGDRPPLENIIKEAGIFTQYVISYIISKR